jgi:predicted RNA-binding Zn-ribbon protein involved in translation (DUF1610 family)
VQIENFYVCQDCNYIELDRDLKPTFCAHCGRHNVEVEDILIFECPQCGGENYGPTIGMIAGTCMWCSNTCVIVKNGGELKTTSLGGGPEPCGT